VVFCAVAGADAGAGAGVGTGADGATGSGWGCGVSAVEACTGEACCCCAAGSSGFCPQAHSAEMTEIQVRERNVFINSLAF